MTKTKIAFFTLLLTETFIDIVESTVHAGVMRGKKIAVLSKVCKIRGIKS